MSAQVLFLVSGEASMLCSLKEVFQITRVKNNGPSSFIS